jgi:hypothetical protein
MVAAPEEKRGSLREIELYLVREADGKHSLGCRADVREILRDFAYEREVERQTPLHHDTARKCRAFLLLPEVVARLKSQMGDKPWQQAFLAENVANNFEIARILSCAPEMDGELRNGEIVFDRVPVPDCYDTLPPLKEPLQVVIVYG